MTNIVGLDSFADIFRVISQTLGGSSAREPNSWLLLGTIILIVAAIVGFAIWRRVAKPELGLTAQPEHILSIFEQAMLHRSRFDAGFYPATGTRQTMSCSLSDSSKAGPSLELPVGITPSPNWIGKEMICYFRLPGERKNPVFYTFIATVRDVRRQGEFQHVDLTFPAKVEMGQKRKHLRLEISSHDIKEFQIFPAAEDGSYHFESDQSKWPDPLAVFSREAESGLYIADISGGGIKVSLDSKQYENLNSFVSKHPVLFMLLELEPVGNMACPPFLLAARLCTKSHETDLGRLTLGYQFIELGIINADNIIDWIKVEPSKGVDDLVTWVFKRHLELYRERESL